MDLIAASLQFPTVVFSLGLTIALFYWLLVLLGALDIDLLGGDVGGDADVEVGKIGGAAAAGGEGAAEAVKGAKPDGVGVWSGLGLGRVPLTVALSAVFLVGWVLSLLAMHHGPGVVGTAPWVAPTVLLLVLIVGLPLAGLLVRPLSGLFKVHEAKSNRDYIGYTCTITTGRVDGDFGQATIEDGGTVLIVPVRCDRPGAFARNDRALIIDFDTARQAYLVEPVADMLLDARESEPGKTA